MSKVLQLWQGMTGTVLPFAGAAAPDGWLLCHGQAVSRATYAVLFAAIGTTYGAGDGSTTFNVPDLRGEFVRGLDSGRGIDTGRALGTAQAHSMQRHNHYLPTSTESSGGPNVGAAINDASFILTNNINIAPAESYTAVTVGDLGNQYGDGPQGLIGDWAAETRPRNVALNYIVKT